LAVGAGVAAVALAACGSNQSGPQVATAPGASTSSSPASTSVSHPDLTHIWAQWAACMRQHGVPMDDPTLDSHDVPQYDFSHATGVPESVKQAARQACQSIINDVPGGSARQASPQQTADLAKCLRANGVPNYPDPDPVTGVSRLTGTGIDVNSPAFQRAFSTCKAKVAGGKG
jgi:hypothetical protein